jgi:hypothetical protein
MVKSSIHDNNMRPLPIADDKEIFIQHDYEFCTILYLKGEPFPKYFLLEKNNSSDSEYVLHEKNYSDWYIEVAITKIDKIEKDRHLITPKLVLEYREVIREAYNHELDSAIKNPYDEPRNKNTIEGVLRIH